MAILSVLPTHTIALSTLKKEENRRTVPKPPPFSLATVGKAVQEAGALPSYRILFLEAGHGSRNHLELFVSCVSACLMAAIIGLRLRTEKKKKKIPLNHVLGYPDLRVKKRSWVRPELVLQVRGR